MTQSFSNSFYFNSYAVKVAFKTEVKVSNEP
jgi:hypothetical protein